jgi:hypothetical protein
MRNRITFVAILCFFSLIAGVLLHGQEEKSATGKQPLTGNAAEILKHADQMLEQANKFFGTIPSAMKPSGAIRSNCIKQLPAKSWVGLGRV